MDEMRVLLAHIDTPNQTAIDTYIAGGGYKTAKNAIGKITPEQIVTCVTKSGLRGRGGAGFVTGKKWSFIPKNSEIAYLVCNCDESEPGTFKDRLLIEKDPHLLIEGMILASYAIGAKKAFIYCRGEYYEGMATLQRAVQEAKQKGMLGENIFGSSFSLDIVVHPGAGAYIAGEETAQLNSLEGFRATPRLKPPFPAISGLYGKPTIINNVETLCNVVHIVDRGAEWFQSIGTPQSSGTKIFQISGHIQNPGCYEFPMGISLRSLLDAAGGIPQGRTFKACYPGGSSSCILTEQDLDIAMAFETLEARKSALGTASVIVMDDSADMVKVSHRLMQFYQNESCGKCTPCREGTRWLVQILARIEAGKGTLYDLTMIDQICDQMSETSFCPLAVGAAFPIVSTLKEFRAEFEARIRCNPTYEEEPKMKISYPYLSKSV